MSKNIFDDHSVGKRESINIEKMSTSLICGNIKQQNDLIHLKVHESNQENVANVKG